MVVSPVSFVPHAVLDIDLAVPLPFLERASSGTSMPYQKAAVLVRLHGHPLGTLRLTIPDQGLEPAALAAVIWQDHNLREAIVEHLQSDHFEAPDRLDEHALATSEALPCWRGSPTSEKAPRISIVIATKDRTSELRECVRTLLGLEYPDFEVVVVDNGATSSETREMMLSTYGNDERVRYVEVAEAGTSNARNKGVEAATGEIVAFTDDDVVVDQHWLRALARRFTLEPDVNCVTGLVMPAALDSAAQEWFEQYGGFNKGYRPRTYSRQREPDLGLLYPYTAGTFGSGNNAAFRRSTLLRLGGFDTRLGPGTPTKTGEDLDVFLAVVMDGGKIAYEPAAIIHHFHRSDYEGLTGQLRSYGVGLTAIFTKWALRSPRHAFEIASRVPLGVWTILSPTSKKNAKKSPEYPVELGREELRGLAQGPIAWFRSVANSSNKRSHG